MTITLSRRDLLRTTGCTLAAAAATRLWTPSAAFGDVDRGGTVVVVFLRGAVDGLNVLVPYNEPAYFNARPTIAVPASAVIDLDGQFGLHPGLAQLKELYDAGLFLPMHAAGSPDDTRSHFDAQANMEGGRLGGQVDGNGWLARHLADLDAYGVPMHAVAWGTAPPASLRGDSAALTTTSLADFNIEADGSEQDATNAAMRQLYASPGGVLHAPAKAVFTALDLMARVRAGLGEARNGAVYPASALGNALREIGQTIHSDVGLLAATVDVGGWDLHAGVGTPEQGAMRNLLVDLAGSLHAFITDLGERAATTRVVVMSEFGRRVEENGSGGTDHGHGNMMFLLGGGLAGRRVHTNWQGLGADALFRGDVPVTTDFRDVLGEVLGRLHGNPKAGSLFSQHTLTRPGVTAG